jgi:mRNA interferase RelE/StbE
MQRLLENKLNPKKFGLSEFRIAETNAFVKKIEKREFLEIYSKIKTKVYPQLKLDPIYGANIKKLKGDYSDFYRYRIGKFRLIFSVGLTEKIIYITDLQLRKDAY